jgi:hypothetical protein
VYRFKTTLILEPVSTKEQEIPSIFSGLSDEVTSAFLSPAISKNGLTWDVGPVFRIPTETDTMLGTKKFGIGPTTVMLWQTKGWTLGALVN